MGVASAKLLQSAVGTSPCSSLGHQVSAGSVTACRLPGTILFIHGAMVNERSWDLMKAWYEGRGYRCQAPSWPERRTGLGLAELADHYQAVVRLQAEPPVLVGHSLGGLLLQVLLHRGPRRAAAA